MTEVWTDDCYVYTFRIYIYMCLCVCGIARGSCVLSGSLSALSRREVTGARALRVGHHREALARADAAFGLRLLLG